MALVTNVLTVDLVDIDGVNIEGINVSASLNNVRLVYPILESSVDDTPETLYPRTKSTLTDSLGVATLTLMPSIDVGVQKGVGNYLIIVGNYNRIITMPDEDIRLSELGDPTNQSSPNVLYVFTGKHKAKLDALPSLYDPSKNYANNDQVSFSEKIYVSVKADNIGNDPSMDITGGSWLPIVTTAIYKRYIAIGLNSDFTEMEFLAGNSSVTRYLITPTFDSPPSQFIAIAVPDNTGDITGIEHSFIPNFSFYVRVAGTIMIDGEDCKVWRTSTNHVDGLSESVFTITQD